MSEAASRTGSAHDVDVAIVGGSIAGCNAATLFARRGLKVALLERRPDMDAHKVVCTHYLQAGTTPTLQRHGWAEAIEAEGGVRNHGHLWTRYGWIRPPAQAEGYSIRREKLDPMLRRTAAATPGVELLLGHTVRDLIWSDGRVAGVHATTKDGAERSIRARLVVAADGRGSGMARLARVPGRVLPHGRFVYWAYFRGLPRDHGGASKAWYLDPDVALLAHCDDDLTEVIAVPVRSRLADFKADLESAWYRFVEALPDAPPVRDAERVSGFKGKLDTPNVQRPAAKNGVAFVGDAALAADPLWAVGCGWAFQSSEWLVDEAADALVEGRDLEPALRSYRNRHRSQLMAHFLHTSSFASGRRFTAAERLLYAAAPYDEELSRRLDEFNTRMIPGQRFLTPGTLARTIKGLAARGGASGRTASAARRNGAHDGAVEGNGRPASAAEASERLDLERS